MFWDWCLRRLDCYDGSGNLVAARSVFISFHPGDEGEVGEGELDEGEVGEGEVCQGEVGEGELDEDGLGPV